MISYALKHPEKLGEALLEHIEMLIIIMLISIIIAFLLTILSMYSHSFAKNIIYLFSIIYSIPSLALFAILIPITGLGETTAIIVLVIYNQYILLRNFIAGLQEIDPSIIEAATGLGMTRLQILFLIRFPLSVKSILTGIRLATVITISMATVAAFINAGGLGTILFDGLRTMNIYKIWWGTILSAGLAIISNVILIQIEKKLTRTVHMN